MNIDEAISILEYHNKWRRGAEIEMTDPAKLGVAIDVIVSYLKKAKQ